MAKKQTTDAPTVDSLVKNAPRFWLGPAAMKQHIRAAANAFLKEVPNRFMADGAKKVGRENGLEGEQFPFQNDCKAAYDAVSLDVGRIAGEVIAHESTRIADSVAPGFPNTKARVRLRVTEEWAIEHQRCAGDLGSRLKDQKKFMFARNLPVDGPTTIRGDYGWKFWLPLTVLAITDLGANYIFLDPASFRQKLVIALASVAVVLGSGIAVSWFRKASRSIVVNPNRFALVQKIMCWLATAFISISFLATLLFFVCYRAGISLLDSGPIVETLTTAFSANPTDFALALFNLLFFGVTIVAFNKAGWQIHGYDKVHDQLQLATESYNASRRVAADAARAVLASSRDEVNQRRDDVRRILGAWTTIQTVFEEIPDMAREAVSVIDAQYKDAVKGYRDVFFDTRHHRGGPDEVQQPIPRDIRQDAPIAPVATTTQPVDADIAQYREQAASFENRAEEWVNENADDEELDRYVTKRRTEVVAAVRQQQTDDLRVAADGGDASAEDEKR